MEGGEGSVVAEPAEEPIADAPKKKEMKAKSLTVKKSESGTSKDITKQIKRQASQLTKIEKAITSLQKSVNKIDNHLGASGAHELHPFLNEAKQPIPTNIGKLSAFITVLLPVGLKNCGFAPSKSKI